MMPRMRHLFGCTNLPHCKGDWCTKVIVGQYLQNFRKNLTRLQKAAKDIAAGLLSPAELEEEYQHKADNNPTALDSDITEDNSFVGADVLDNVDDAGAVDNRTGAVVATSGNDGLASDDDASGDDGDTE
jgi:hypothetical protein